MTGPRGFTLIELVAVLAIMALTAAAVALDIRGPLRRIGMRSCLDEVVAFDRLTRTYAQEQDRAVQVMVDLGAGRLRRTDEEGRADLGTPVEVPAPYRLARLRLAGQDIRWGTAALACSPQGLTPTWAILVEGPGNRRRWAVFAGLSGQVLETENDHDVDSLFAAIETGRQPG